MKKILYTTALMLMTTLVLTSCDGLNGSQKKLKEQMSVTNKDIQNYEHREEATTVTYKIYCSQEFVDAIDMVVTYKGKGGINLTDTVRDTTWVKTVVNDSIPVKIGIDWILVPKKDRKITKERFDNLMAGYNIECKEAAFTIGNGIIGLHKNFPVSKLEALCELYNFQHKDVAKACNILKAKHDAWGVDALPADWDD